MDEPVNESIKYVDANTLLVGPLQLHRSKGYSDTSTWYDQDDDMSYTVTKAPVPPPPTSSPPANGPKIELVYDVGRATAVWSIGNSAFCKVKIRTPGTTPEVATLAFVHTLKPGFEIPKVFHETEHNNRSYMFMSRVPGRTLGVAWPTLDKEWRHHYAKAIVDVCKFLERQECDTFCGADGKNVLQPYLIKTGAEHDYSPGNLQQMCESMGMDCSKFVFYHSDLGPGNIIVEEIPKTGSVGIIDWESAGYFPRGWIRTKFLLSRGMNLEDAATDDPQEWRAEVEDLLGEHGFEEYTSQWETCYL